MISSTYSRKKKKVGKLFIPREASSFWENVWEGLWFIGWNGIWEGMVEAGLSGWHVVLKHHVAPSPCHIPSSLRPWTYSEHNEKHWVRGVRSSLEGAQSCQGPASRLLTEQRFLKDYGDSPFLSIYSLSHHADFIFIPQKNNWFFSFPSLPHLLWSLRACGKWVFCI